MRQRAGLAADAPDLDHEHSTVVPPPDSVLAAGNSAMAGLLQRAPAGRFVPRLPSAAGNLQVYRQAMEPTAAPVQEWTKPESKEIQHELRRLRLYTLKIDGIIGRYSDQGLVEAFGGDEWRTLDAATTLTRLRGATRPEGAGHDLRYGELFKDGLLDITLGVGFTEEFDAVAWVALARDMDEALTARGYVDDPQRATELFAEDGREVSDTGRFFVKENALVYQPPAGPPRPVHAIVRLLMNPTGAEGAETRAAFEQGMAEGDAAYYTGHARYGSGPDFDRNFGRFTMTDAQGNVEHVIDDYALLERELRKEGDPWQRFQWRIKHDQLAVEFSNAGNLRLTARNLHGDEFGARLLYWAMDQTGTVAATGPGGALATEAAAHPERKYRVLAFKGCNTEDYGRGIRSTPGFDTWSTDIIDTGRVVKTAGIIEAFTAFLDAVVRQQSAEGVVEDMNQAMKGKEPFTTKPFGASGLADNPSR